MLEFIIGYIVGMVITTLAIAFFAGAGGVGNYGKYDDDIKKPAN